VIVYKLRKPQNCIDCRNVLQSVVNVKTRLIEVVIRTQLTQPQLSSLT